MEAGMYLFISNTVPDTDASLVYNYASFCFFLSFLLFEAEAYVPQASLHLVMQLRITLNF